MNAANTSACFSAAAVMPSNCPRCSACGHDRGQQLDGELVARRHHHGALDVVLQLADVPGPLILLQGGQSPRVNVGHVAVVLLIVQIQKMSD